MALYGHQSSKLVVDLLQKLYEKDHNLVLSPYSLTSALTMLLVGTTEGSSRLQLVKAVFDANSAKTEDADQHAKAFAQRNNANLGKNQDTLVVGNMLYSAKSFPLKSEFVSTLSNEFRAVSKQLDFVGANAAAVEIINSDVSKVTRGLIKELLASIDASTSLILVNAIYFKGLWAKPFEKELTDEKGEFHLSSGQTVHAALMTKKRRFAYFEDDQQSKAKAIELDYQSDGNISMVFILPCEGVSLESFVRSLTAEQLDNILRNLYPRGDVRLVLPRFKLSAQHQLASILREIGIKDVFDGSKAPLGNISPNSQGLALSEVIQKAVVEVNEEGTKAAAATAMMLCGCAPGMAPPKPLEFIANRPFLYVLATNDQPRQILFVGAVEDPSKTA